MTENPRIMVVDDEEEICRNIVKILEKNNYDVAYATNAKQALDQMASETFSLLITDLVMPEMNGLELLKAAKAQIPVLKAIMMTAYASTDTALKAVRLGALDYIPKPFTPKELREIVDRALSGQLVEAQVDPAEREAIDTIDMDIPFDADEVARQTGEAYVKSIGPSDRPVVEVTVSEDLEHYCQVGEMVCDIFKKLGATCKAGTKSGVCPQKKKAKKGKDGGQADVKKLIGIDQPFDYDEVVSVTGPQYLRQLHNEGVAYVPYEELKQNVSRLMAEARDKIDQDMPFDANEVEALTTKGYPEKLGPSDRPVVEVTAESGDLENFCQVGDMVCDIFKKLGATCKAGLKSGVCPQKKKAKKAAPKGFDAKKYVGVDFPFEYDEVVEITGPDYINNLQTESTVIRPYEQLKAEITRKLQTQKDVQTAKPSRAILVIDDEVAVNNNIRKILAKKGYRVDQATSKQDAVERLGQKAYNVILLDLKMPGVKGLELLQVIRDKNPQAKVIIITGYASIETAIDCARLGAVDYLPKPFTTDEIRAKTDRAYQLCA